MTNNKTHNFPGYVLTFVFLLAVVNFVIVAVSGSTEGLFNNTFGIILATIPLLGGIFGLFMSKGWGGFGSAIGKGVIFLSLGLLSWSIGTFIFAGYYNIIAEVVVPYPSIADVAYILSWPLWGIGVFYLSRATGAKYGLRSSLGKYFLLIVPLAIIAVSYYLLVVIARGGQFDFADAGVLKVFFDLAYPIGDVVILTLATVIFGLSFKYFGGIYKKAIYTILFSFIVMYFADFAFSYTTTLETWFPGDWVDLLFASAVFLLSLGVTSLKARTATQ